MGSQLVPACGRRAGDVLELEPGTRHAATVGPNGVRCAEAAV